MRRFASILLGMLLVGFTAASTAADVPAADVKSVRAVIQGQLAALATDDAKRAFSFATPELRIMFGSANNFMAMVRTSYPVVYRPASVAFLKPELDGNDVIQAVHMTDADGALWLALYRLERQRDKSWRISACQIVEASGRVASS